MLNGDRDTSTAITDATVQVNGGCTGVLVAPNLVLTAGHCIPDGARPRFPRRSLWNDLRSPVRIDFGNDKRNFKLTVEAREYNPAGLIDISLLRLRSPVPPNIARPARPMAVAPKGVAPEAFLKGKTLVAAGWGQPGGTRYRQTGETKFDAMPYSVFGTLEPARFRTRGANQLEPGDSGSPIYWVAPRTAERHLIGIAQGVQQRGGRYYCLSSDGGLEPRKKFRQPSLAAWLDRELAANALPDGPVLPLYSWWNRVSNDNYATTSPGWGYTTGEYAPSGIVYSDTLEHIYNGRKNGGHALYRLDGYLFDPHERQPAGTIPVFSWFHQDRGDHRLSSDPKWRIPLRDVRWRRDLTTLTNRRTLEGYTLRRLEGFAYNPKRPQPPGTVPLYSWWNPRRADNFATTQPNWAGDPSGLQWRGEHLANQISRSGYSRYRLEGYVLAPNRT